MVPNFYSEVLDSQNWLFDFIIRYFWEVTKLAQVWSYIGGHYAAHGGHAGEHCCISIYCIWQLLVIRLDKQPLEKTEHQWWDMRDN